MIHLLANINVTTFWQEGGPLWFLAGAAAMFIPKLLEWIRNWRKDGNENKAEKRRDLLERLTTMEDIISNQQSRYMILHQQLITERETAQNEKMELQKQVFDLERRVEVLEEKIKADEALLASLQGEDDVSGD